jgi:hypothetical protein
MNDENQVINVFSSPEDDAVIRTLRNRFRAWALTLDAKRGQEIMDVVQEFENDIRIESRPSALKLMRVLAAALPALAGDPPPDPPDPKKP